jgi:hypothetical protein
MTEPSFEIRCPRCGSVVPPEASGCQSCTRPVAARAEAVPAAVQAPAIGTMRIKDYHRLVRDNYWAVEGPRVRSAGGFRLQAYLPFALLLLGLFVGALLAFGRI